MNADSLELFFELVRAGLWKNDVRLSEHEQINWQEIYQLSCEQSVLGLMLAGLEHSDVKPPQVMLLQWIGEVQQTEQRNVGMNRFIGELFEKFNATGTKAVLVKGQGVAQCYNKPLWRSCGDIDLLMDGPNYEKAKSLLIPIAEKVENEDVIKKHLGLYVNDFLIELHGRMPFEISRRVDRVLDGVIERVCDNHTNGANDLQGVPIPKPEEHLIIVFTHFLHHFFVEGVGLRQVCDWARLLWCNRNNLDLSLLEKRVRGAGLMTEWKAFASLAVDKLSMPIEAMPFYDSRFKVKGEKVLKRVLKSGNFGHNNDLSYRTRFKGVSYKIIATWRRFVDFASLVPMLPEDAPKFFFTYLFNKAK